MTRNTQGSVKFMQLQYKVHNITHLCYFVFLPYLNRFIRSVFSYFVLVSTHVQTYWEVKNSFIAMRGKIQRKCDSPYFHDRYKQKMPVYLYASYQTSCMNIDAVRPVIVWALVKVVFVTETCTWTKMSILLIFFYFIHETTANG